MSTTKKSAKKKEVNESFTEKIGHMISDVTHSVQEIPFRKIVKKAARAINNVMHPGAKPAKKRQPSATPVKKTAVKKVAAKKAAPKPVAKKTAKKAVAK